MAAGTLLSGCVTNAMQPGDVLLSAHEVVLPAHWQERGDLITLDVTVNGQGPYVFLLDTGAINITVVSPEVARWRSGPADLLVQFMGTKDVAGNRSDVEDPAKFASVRVGGMELRNLNALVAELDDLSDSLGFHIDGVLGCPAFSSGCLTLNYPARRVSFGDQALGPVDGTTVFPLLEEGVPIMNLRLMDQGVPVVLDSAWAGGFDLGDLPLLVEPTILPLPRESVLGIARKLIEYRWAQIHGTLELGPITLVDPVVRVGRGTRNIVGTRVLKHYRVVLDLANARMAMEGEPETTVFVSPIGTGASLFFDADGCYVKDILPGSPAEAKGLKKGDRVLSVNDIPTGSDVARETGKAEVVRRVEGLVNSLGALLKFTVRREDHTLLLEIPVVELLR